MKTLNPHKFSPSLAQSHGVHAALLHNYLCILFHEKKGKTCKEIKVPTLTLCEQFCYLTLVEIRRALFALKTPLKGGAPGFDSFFERSDAVCCINMVNGDVSHNHYENMGQVGITIAIEHGLCAAMIYDDLRDKILNNWFCAADELYSRIDTSGDPAGSQSTGDYVCRITKPQAYHQESTKQWHKRWQHSFSLNTVRESFARLKSSSLIVNPYAGSPQDIWSLSPSEMDATAEEVASFLSGCGTSQSDPLPPASRLGGQAEGRACKIR